MAAAGEAGALSADLHVPPTDQSEANLSGAVPQRRARSSSCPFAYFWNQLMM